MIAAGLLAGCSGRPRPVRVGSKNFTEQLILGEIAAEHLENRLHVSVERRLNLGGTLLAHQALVAGQIDLYPEYTGTALTNVLNLPVDYEVGAVGERVRQEYERRFQAVWMPPLGFANGFAIAIRGADARAHNLASLSDAVGYLPGWRLGAGYEFIERPDGFNALMKTYSLPMKASPRTMDLGLVYRALESGQVDMSAGSETDGMLSAIDVKVLADDKHAFPPYEAAFVVREEALSAHPGLREALGELSGKFNSKMMQSLNYQADGKHVPIAEIAKGFLKQVGLDAGTAR